MDTPFYNSRLVHDDEIVVGRDFGEYPTRGRALRLRENVSFPNVSFRNINVQTSQFS